MPSVVRFQRGDGDTARHTFIDERNAAVLDGDAVDAQLSGSGLRRLRIGRVRAQQALPVRAAVRAAHQPHIRAFQNDAVGHQPAPQQREQRAPSCAPCQVAMGSGPKARSVSEPAFAGAKRQPGKESEVDITHQREFPAGGIAHRRFDVRLETIGVDEPDDHQHGEHRQGDDRTESQRKPFENTQTHAADIVSMSAARFEKGARSGSTIADVDVSGQRLGADASAALDR